MKFTRFGVTRFGVTLVGVTLFGVTPVGVFAQRPAGADTMSVQAVAESLKVLKGIRAQLEKDKNNAALWYRRGMLAWMLYDRDRSRGGLREIDWTLLGREADSSIRLAARIDTKNARYELTKGQYFIASGWIPLRVQAYHVLDVALAKAKASGDARLLAEAAVEKGRVHWRRYDPGNSGGPTLMGADIRLLERDKARDLVKDTARLRQMMAYDVDLSEDNALTRGSLRMARNMLSEQYRSPDGGFTGELNYTQAENYFRQAYAADPTYKRAYTQLAMLLAERARWSEVARTARTQIGITPREGWVWMTLALAVHRQEQYLPAQALFDTALSLLPPVERARLDNFARILRPVDSARYRALPASDRAAMEQLYWHSADPLWSQEGGKPRYEFLARVAYAELRWSVDELLNRRGADSDRGAVHIRYGPADMRGGREWWGYTSIARTFWFHGAPTFGTAYLGDPYGVSMMMDSVPARWDNLVHGRVDSMAVQVTRFRGDGDSVDVVFASNPPINAIRDRSDLGAPVRSDFWLLSGSTILAHDSTAPSASSVRFFSHRVAQGHYVYRFEASAEASLIAARALAPLRALRDTTTGFDVRGFGISDVMMTGNAIPRGGTRRWTGITVSPIVGPVRRATEIALMWENYDLGLSADSSAHYDVTLSLRGERTPLESIRARIINAMRATLFGDFVGDKVQFKYERRVPYATAFADYINVNLAETPAGDYWLTLEVTDRATNRTAARILRLTIRE